MQARAEAAKDMIRAAASFYQFGWLMGTSGNLSVRLEDELFLISASGRNKGELTEVDFLLCDLNGDPAEKTTLRPSAETLLHCVIYRKNPECKAIFHVHHPGSALCSARDFKNGFTTFTDLEMIKGLDIWDKDQVRIPIVENHRHIPNLAEAVDQTESEVPGIMVLRHGYYAWGRSAFETRRHVESLAYLFDYAWAANPHIG
jgi:methylthioribulose-1-phosphate dehydratase